MNPLGTPVIISRFSYSRSRIFSDSRVSSGIVWNDGLIRFSEISKMRCSASSRKPSTSAGASYDELAISVAIDPRLRSTALSCTIRA